MFDCGHIADHLMGVVKESLDSVMYRGFVAGRCLSGCTGAVGGWRPVAGDEKERRVSSKRCSREPTTTPPRPCSAVSSANRGACTRATKEPRTRSPVSGIRHPHSVSLFLCLPPTHTLSLLQPDSNTTSASIKTPHVVANIHQPIMTRPAKDMRFLLGSHRHQHHHHNA